MQININDLASVTAALEAMKASPVIETVAVEQPKSSFELRALPIIARHIPIIPVPARTKAAKLSGWPERATTDPAQIAEWAKQEPDANIACVAKPDGYWFFELDRDGLKDQIERDTGQKFPATFMVRSSPGRGHVYFKQNAASLAMGNRQAKDAHGELWSARVANKYVIGPNSIHPSGAVYTVLVDAPIVEAPQWLIDYCMKNDTSEQQKAAVPDHDTIVEGGRNTWLASELGRARQKSNLNREELYALGLVKNHQHCQPPLPDHEVRTIANSIGGYAVTEAPPVILNGKPAGHSPAVADDRPTETESINPTENSEQSLDWLPMATLASTRLQDIYGEYFQENNWPLTLALPALVTAASVVVPPMQRDPNKLIHDDNMVNLYTALIADVNAGKSQAIEWTCRAIGIYEDPIGSHYFSGKWGSAEQLIRSLNRKQSMFTSKQCLINPDEWAHLFAKAAIPDASFPTVLTTSFYRRNQMFTLGGTDGGKEYSLNLAMSFIGGIVEDEFDTVFGASSLGGLYDRFLFGRAPDHFKWNYVPCPIPTAPHFSGWDMKPVSVNPEIYEVTRAWGKQIPGLGRIAEICVRIATIYASLDGRPEVKGADIDILKPLALYQIGLRQVFRPNPGQSPDAIFANTALAWITKHAGEWTSITKLKQHTWRVESKLGPAVAVRSLLGLARSGRIDLWLAGEGRPMPSDYTGPKPRIGLVRRVR